MTQFAGIEYPKTLCLFRQPLSKRLAEFKQHHKLYPFTGPYYQNEPSPNTNGHSFYLESDFAPDLRYTYADDVDGARIGHTGWFTDEFGDSDTIRGIVFRLPHNRGFLAGWTMGKQMASSVEYYIYADEVDAARGADSLAQSAAERQREYEAEQRAEDEANEGMIDAGDEDDD